MTFIGLAPKGEIVYMTLISAHQWPAYFESTSYYTTRP